MLKEIDVIADVVRVFDEILKGSVVNGIFQKFKPNIGIWSFYGYFTHRFRGAWI